MTTRTAAAALAMMAATATLLAAQAGDAAKVLAEARAALGGDRKLDAVKTLTLSGQSLRTSPGGATTEGDLELAFEFPDKFTRREVAVNMGNMSVYRVSGFNGDGVINEMDTPPQLSGGGGAVVMFRMAGPGGATVTMGGGATPTPEQKEAARQMLLTASKQDFARLTLGFFAASFASYPLTMTSGGQAESPDGKADIIDVKGDGNFAVRLFIDASTHLPLMLSWMAKEPMQITRQIGGPGGAVAVGPGGGAARPATPPAKMTPEERQKLEQQLEADAKERAAKARTVEYRLFYADYRQVDGVMIPFRLQRSIDGKPTEEVSFDKVKVNPKLDAKAFAVSK
jgi:hypothetical protein